MKKTFLTLLLTALSMASAFAQDDIATFRTWAMTPPMGWNSWDCYYSSVTEKEVMQNAKYLVDNDLVKYGWEYRPPWSNNIGNTDVIDTDEGVHKIQDGVPVTGSEVDNLGSSGP